MSCYLLPPLRKVETEPTQLAIIAAVVEITADEGPAGGDLGTLDTGLVALEQAWRVTL